MYKGIIYVPNSQELKKLILREMHNVSYVGQLGYQKIFAVVKSQYYWAGMKKVLGMCYILCMCVCGRVRYDNCV
jgi:hypothetical protein